MKNTIPLIKDFDALAKKLDDSVHHELAKSSMGLSPLIIALAVTDWLMHLSVSPGKQATLSKKALELMADVLKNPSPGLQAEQGQSHRSDSRFTDPAWNTWPYAQLKDIFIAQHSWWDESVEIEGMEKHHLELVHFYIQQFMDALSPSNYPITNPEFLNKYIQTLGQSWLKGLSNFYADAWTQSTRGINQATGSAQKLAFEPGRDVAVTPGAVVFENHLIELIQYEPTTKNVSREPLLIVPSCIMKYYILDLSPQNSMVKFLVDQGLTVFMISWRNPESSDRALDFNDYLNLGVIQAIRAVQSVTQCEQLHTMGYCLGGTFLAIVSAFLGHHQSSTSKGDNYQTPALIKGLPKLSSTILLAAQTDFSDPGQLGLLIDQDQLKTLREAMATTGFLSGKQMAASFKFLNARDLIWSKNTKRYLLGEEETTTDMTSWNADVTRLPEKMHSEYLDKFFLNNALSTGYFEYEGRGIALMDIKSPMLVVGTERDTVSPWKSVYKINLLTNTDTTFILASGGHNAGIVSEPGHPKRSYHIHHSQKGHGWLDPLSFKNLAQEHTGSWWPEMSAWLKKISKVEVPARGILKKQTIRQAPGRNVMVRYMD